MKVPAIRFKGFSDEWERSELGGLIEITSASRVHKNEWTESGVPFFRSSDVVANYKGLVNEKAFISYELYKELSDKSGCVKKNDLLVTGGGSIGIPYLIKTNEPLYFKDADLLWLKNGGKLNGYFLYTFFSTLSFRRYVNSITHIGTISHYTVIQAKSTPIDIPDKDEQDEIGEFLLNLDKLISLHQAKVKKLTHLKKAMLEKIFPKDGADVPEIRFKGFVGAWEEKTLKQIVSNVSDGNWIEANHIYEEGEYRIIQTGNLGIGEFIDKSSNAKYFHQKDFDEVNGNEIFPGDILISRLADPAGRTILLPKTGFKMVTAVDISIIRPNSSMFDSSFLMTQLNTTKILNFVNKSVSGTSHKRISRRNLEKIKLLAPIVKEQEKIGEYFQNLDRTITLHQTELEKLNNLKKACLEKMFV